MERPEDEYDNPTYVSTEAFEYDNVDRLKRSTLGGNLLATGGATMTNGGAPRTWATAPLDRAGPARMRIGVRGRKQSSRLIRRCRSSPKGNRCSITRAVPSRRLRQFRAQHVGGELDKPDCGYVAELGRRSWTVSITFLSGRYERGSVRPRLGSYGHGTRRRSDRKTGRGGGGGTHQHREQIYTHGMTLSRSRFSLLKQDIAKNGIQQTIEYVEVNGRKYIVDGHHRVLAARQLGINTIPTEEVKLPYSGYKTVDDLFSDRGW
jgi:hypothetical protein